MGRLVSNRATEFLSDPSVYECFLQNLPSPSSAPMNSVRSLNANTMYSNNNYSSNNSNSKSICSSSIIKSFSLFKHSPIFIKFTTRIRGERRWTAMHSMLVAISFLCSMFFSCFQKYFRIDFPYFLNLLPFQCLLHCRRIN